MWTGAGYAIERLWEELEAGEPWFPAFLRAIARWDKPAERFRERDFVYLLADEAFDWLVLVERLALQVGHLAPQDELDALLFHGAPPGGLDEAQFAAAIGPAKHRTFLNFHYGVVVEEALARSVEDQVAKERMSSLRPVSWRAVEEEAYERIYGAPFSDLLLRFRAEIGELRDDTLSLTDLKRFRYWLFKLRIKNAVGVKIAADTKRGLECLTRLRASVWTPAEIDGEARSTILIEAWSYRVLRDEAHPG